MNPNGNSYWSLVVVIAVATLSMVEPILTLLPHALAVAQWGPPIGPRLVWVWASSTTIARSTPIFVTAYFNSRNGISTPLLVTGFCQLLIIGATWVAAVLIQDDVLVSTITYIP
jgi:hypothetical protein